MSISTSLKHATFQTAGGLLIGGVSDQMFPSDTTVNRANVLQKSGEIFFQILVNAAGSAAFFDFLGRSALREDDPTKGAGYFMALIGAQPNLGDKIKNLVSYVGHSLQHGYSGPALGRSSGHEIGKPAPSLVQLANPGAADEFSHKITL